MNLNGTTHFRFSDKTKNSWEDRHNFEKVPGKYDLLIMDYNAEKEEADAVDACPVKEEKTQIDSTLDKRIQNLVELICNIQAMEEILKEMKYDTKKAPLGLSLTCSPEQLLSMLFVCLG